MDITKLEELSIRAKGISELIGCLSEYAETSNSNIKSCSNGIDLLYNLSIDNSNALSALTEQCYKEVACNG